METLDSCLSSNEIVALMEMPDIYDIHAEGSCTNAFLIYQSVFPRISGPHQNVELLHEYHIYSLYSHV